MLQAQARNIATAYMDEILLRKHDEEAATGRAGRRGDWESIRCCDGLNEPLTTQFGNPITGPDNYQVNVAVNGTAPADIVVNVSQSTGSVNLSIQSDREPIEIPSRDQQRFTLTELLIILVSSADWPPSLRLASTFRASNTRHSATSWSTPCATPRRP